jgi:putative transposase
MGKLRRMAVAGHCYHVLNRAVEGRLLFADEPAYRAFARLLDSCLAAFPVSLYAYCLMPNHWHLVLSPGGDDVLASFMRKLTLTHSQRLRGFGGTVGGGAVYQGRYRSFPVESERYFLTVCRYVERNPVRAGLVARAAGWPWSSAAAGAIRTAPWPLPRPAGWAELVDQPLAAAEVAAIRACVRRGAPLGTAAWVATTAAAHGLAATLRRRGRPPAP